MAIIMIITAIVFTSQNAFNQTLVLANTAYDVALSLRSAESFGLGARGASGVTNAGYGIHFTVGNTFVSFADTAGGVSCNNSTPICKIGDGVYTAGSDSSAAQTTIGNGVTVSKFCALSGITSVWSCSSGTLTSIDVVFTRPDPTPSIKSKSTSGGPVVSYSNACIELSSPQGAKRFVSVEASGEINANETSCP